VSSFLLCQQLPKLPKALQEQPQQQLVEAAGINPQLQGSTASQWAAWQLSLVENSPGFHLEEDEQLASAFLDLQDCAELACSGAGAEAVGPAL